jgi:hypothetical protein
LLRNDRWLIGGNRGDARPSLRFRLHESIRFLLSGARRIACVLPDRPYPVRIACDTVEGALGAIGNTRGELQEGADGTWCRGEAAPATCPARLGAVQCKSAAGFRSSNDAVTGPITDARTRARRIWRRVQGAEAVR